jgi:Flp pilus assembly pilin Flp
MLVSAIGLVQYGFAGATDMAKLLQVAFHLRHDERGQDMVEYALLAASIAVVVAGFLPPAIMPAVSTIFSKIISGFNAS